MKTWVMEPWISAILPGVDHGWEALTPHSTLGGGLRVIMICRWR